MHFIWKTLLISIPTIVLNGCVPVLIGGGIVAGGYNAIRDKGVGNSINDTKIDCEIKKKLYVINPQLYSEVSVVTNNGIVLLTGSVSYPDWVNTSEKEAWSVRGVIGVDNNLMTGGPLSVSQMLKDDYITSACKAILFSSSEIRSVNYKIKTSDNIVYITGMANTQKELDLVILNIRKIKGVKKVVSYITLK